MTKKANPSKTDSSLPSVFGNQTVEKDHLNPEHTTVNTFARSAMTTSSVPLGNHGMSIQKLSSVVSENNSQYEM